MKTPIAIPSGWFAPTLCFWSELKDIMTSVPNETAGMASATTSPDNSSSNTAFVPLISPATTLTRLETHEA